MTELLYMKDSESNYIREFDAAVISVGEGYAVLDRSAFYPTGGGQESDTGIISWESGAARVRDVQKKDYVRHFLYGAPPPAGTKVHGKLDWERRISHMRMHTAQHIISGVVFDLFSARTVGNQIHADRSRVDFAPVRFSEDDMKKIEDACNIIISKKAVVKIYEQDRAELEKRVDSQRANLDIVPQSVRVLRIVEIEGYDICPCAGTHVRNTSEIGLLKILRTEKKGKGRERLEYALG